MIDMCMGQEDENGTVPLLAAFTDDACQLFCLFRKTARINEDQDVRCGDKVRI
ncbi:MAG: hypothetical protein A4E34_01002 [Methanoregula sp. PtaU1.Bin006]|nr:MAG: hypothetical protein A4E33_00786 [Methanoregula sp. PtaB.Bin085]OPY35115.1 MAG: hypothetical protein A4E34_01002 [Methanoregula sp. PtaU1.Bin006]